MLCKLLYDVVPWKFHQRVIFSWGIQYMPIKHVPKIALGAAGVGKIWLNLKAIAIDAQESSSHSASIWRWMLKIGFHEFGHIALGHCRRNALKRYNENDWQFRRHAEGQATAKAEEWMGKVLACNGRLYQPDFLGAVDAIRHKRRNYRKINEARCHITGGQLSAVNVAHNLFCIFQIEVEDELDCQGWERELRRKVRLVHKYGDDLARIHIDSAGRHHHFWIWGDLSIIGRRLASLPETHWGIEDQLNA